MRTLDGWVTKGGYGLASENYARLRERFGVLAGIPRLLDGTLNIKLASAYTVRPFALIPPRDYNGQETLKLQQCIFRGIKCVIVRPTTHEGLHWQAHGPAHLELMSSVHLRSRFGLSENSPADVEVEGDDGWWEGAS